MARTLNKTYKITRTKPRAWTAGFYVKVSSSKITRVYNKFYKAIRGKITNVKLRCESQSFEQKINGNNILSHALCMAVLQYLLNSAGRNARNI